VIADRLGVARADPDVMVKVIVWSFQSRSRKSVPNFASAPLEDGTTPFLV
jgi:hypothetical protein